ncbi:hypothetical protein PV703_30695, partial [Streptomyces sp. ME01-24h]|nr:hypothetical protein [Streptomyces sp. ME01-24h]
MVEASRPYDDGRGGTMRSHGHGHFGPGHHGRGERDQEGRRAAFGPFGPPFGGGPWGPGPEVSVSMGTH